MSFTTTQLTQIEVAMASGVLTVEIDGVRTTYQSLEAMRKQRDLMRAELQAAGALAAPVNQSRQTFATVAKV